MQLIMRMHLWSRWLLERGFKPVSRLMDGMIRVVCSARIPAEAQIHPTVRFSHNGLAVLITRDCKIGPGCQIGTHAILGSNWPKLGAPQIEANAMIGPGAIVLGPVKVGKGSLVAANSVVLDDVPPGVLVAGNPAKIKKRDIDINAYLYPESSM